MGLRTVLGLGEAGFFTPYRYASVVPKQMAYPEVEALFSKAQDRFGAVLGAVGSRSDALQAIGGTQPPAPRWDQAWFAPLDAAVAYVMVRDTPPERIIEVGSGHSTRFLAQALRDGDAQADQLCIDPAPRASLDGLPVRWEKTVLSDEHLPQFDALRHGDIAFFDSSHILWPGTDVDMILNRILPRLRPGVRVHIHDIFLPDPYPDDWTWRGYTEQIGLAGWLLGGGFEPLFASAYAVSRMEALKTVAALPRHAEAIDSSLWMVKK